MSVITTSIVANKADAYAKNIATLTSGMAGAEIEFEFSSEWEGLSKTAVFKAGSTTKYVILTTSNKCPIPYECLTTARVNLIVGVYGTNGDNVIIPTIYCSLGLISEGTAVTGSEPGEITQSLYNQVVALIDDCEDELVNVKETAVKQVDVDASGADQVGTVGVSLTTSWVDATDHTKGKKATFVFTNLKGIQGSPGAAATIAAGTTTTGEAGTSASVVNSGTSSAAVFDFTIPRGADGTDGVSPGIVITDIPGGHRVTITDAAHPGGQSFDIFNGTGAGDMLASVYDAEGGVKQVAFKADLNTVAYSGKSSDLTNDAGFLTEHQSLAAYRTSADQDVIDATKVPSGRIVNGHALTENVTIADTDIAHGSTTVGAELTEQSSQIVLLNSTVNGHTTDILNLQRRTKNNITSNLANLPTAIAQQNLEKYGYAIGDYFVGASGYTYWLADMDTYYGGYNSYAVVSTHHCAVVVDTKSSSQWDSANTAPRYDASALHTYLSGTVLNNVKSDLNALFGSWSSHIISHEMLANGIGTWGWSGANYIRAMTELEVYGSKVWSADNYQQGEAVKQLELFRKFRFNEIFGNTWFWLRSLYSSSIACAATNSGDAAHRGVPDSTRASGLILLY